MTLYFPSWLVFFHASCSPESFPPPCKQNDQSEMKIGFHFSSCLNFGFFLYSEKLDLRTWHGKQYLVWSDSFPSMSLISLFPVLLFYALIYDKSAWNHLPLPIEVFLSSLCFCDTVWSNLNRDTWQCFLAKFQGSVWCHISIYLVVCLVPSTLSIHSVLGELNKLSTFLLLLPY